MSKSTKILAPVLLGFSMLTAALGSQVTFVTQPGASDADGALAAIASFTTSANTLTIQVSNKITNIVSDGQAISDVKWTLDTSSAGASITSSSGDLGKVRTGGAFTDYGTFFLFWQLEPNGLGLCILCVGGKPNELIIGPRNSDNKYDFAKASIVQHNPVINTSATWILNVPGLTASNKVTSATFSFGTQEGIDRTCFAEVPEPASLVLMGLGLSGLGIRRKLRSLKLIDTEKGEN